MVKTRCHLVATWLVCLLGLATLGAAPVEPAPPAPESEEARLVRVLLELSRSSAQERKTGTSFELRCEDVVVRWEPLQRVAKNPRALEASRRILGLSFQNDQGPQYVAAAVLASSGDRGSKTRKYLKTAHASCVVPAEKQRFLELLAPFGIQGAHNALAFAVLAPHGAGEPGSIEPLFEYRQGEWEPSLVERMRGPGKWFLYSHSQKGSLVRHGAVAAKTETELYTTECGNSGWGFKVSKLPGQAWLALSKDLPLNAFTPSPPELRASLDRLTARSPAAVLSAMSWMPDSKPTCEPFKAWREVRDANSRLTTLCTGAASEGKRLCYVERLRTFAFGEKGSASACSQWCRSEDWVDMSGEAPRIFRTDHYCQRGEYHLPDSVAPTAQYLPGGSHPVVSLVLDGRTYVLTPSTCYEGCNGFGMLEVSEADLRGVIHRDSTAACD